MIFATYSSLIGESQSGGKYKTRFQQLLHWCGEDFDGVVSFCQLERNNTFHVNSTYLNYDLNNSRWRISLTSYLKIVYDECHKAKNVCPVGSSKPTKTGLAVLELQNKLPKARVVYASATGL